MAATFTKIATVTVGAGGASSIDFSSIPATYTDLCLKLSARGSATGGAYAHYAVVSFNSNTSNRSWRRLAGYSSSTYSDNSSSVITMGSIPSSGATASAFANCEWYIPNYAGSNYKSWSIDAVVDTNSSTDWENYFMAHLWSNTSAITSIGITLDSGNFVQYSTATLYGIKNS